MEKVRWLSHPKPRYASVSSKRPDHQTPTCLSASTPHTSRALEVPFLRQPAAMFHLAACEETLLRGQTGQGPPLCPLAVHSHHVCLCSANSVPSTRLGTVQYRERQKEGLFWKLCRGEVGTCFSWQGMRTKGPLSGVTPEPSFLVEQGLGEKKDVSL